MSAMTRQIGERVAIAERDGPPPGHPVVEHLQLPSPDAGQHVAHAVVVAHLGVVVGPAGIARLGGPEPRLLHPLAVVGDQHSAAGGGDDLVAVERERAHRRDASRPAGPGRACRAPRRHPPAAAPRSARRAPRSDPCPRSGRTGGPPPAALGSAAHAGPLRQRMLEHVGIEIPARPLAVEEDRRGAQVGDRVDRGDEGERGRQDLVAGADAEQPKTQMQRGRPARDRHRREPDPRG